MAKKGNQAVKFRLCANNLRNCARLNLFQLAFEKIGSIVKKNLEKQENGSNVS